MWAYDSPSSGEHCAQYIAELRLVRHELFCFIFIFLSRFNWPSFAYTYTVRVCLNYFSYGLVGALFVNN